MSFTLTKQYSDLNLLFRDDIYIMWEELEAKINGGIDADNVAQNWAALSQVALEKDMSFSIGATDSLVMRYISADESFGFYHVTTPRNVIFKINGEAILTLDDEGNLTSSKNVYFSSVTNNISMSALLGYSKPVLVYSDSTTVNMEQNTATASTSLVVFPNGPIQVTETIPTTHKFRQLKLSATANGYSSSHTGAADSGLKAGITLTANTWYFVYAVIVQGGDDLNKFIMVVDTVNPNPSNHATLNTSYGSGKWVYLGCLRYGHGEAQTTTLVPFLQDKSGWTMFTGRAASGNLFGIRVSSSTGVSTSGTSLYVNAIANSGNAVPSNCSMLQLSYRPIADTDESILGRAYVTDASSNTIITLPSFSTNLEATEAHGWSLKIPNVSSIALKAVSTSSTNDFNCTTYISGVLDEWR